MPTKRHDKPAATAAHTSARGSRQPAGVAERSGRRARHPRLGAQLEQPVAEEESHDDDLLVGGGQRLPAYLRQRVGGLRRRDDALRAGELQGRLEALALVQRRGLDQALVDNMPSPAAPSRERSARQSID